MHIAAPVAAFALSAVHRRRRAPPCASAAPLQATDYEAVVGLETHVQLNTRTKAFCACANTFAAPPNAHTCPTCLGLPVRLPGRLPSPSPSSLCDAGDAAGAERAGVAQGGSQPVAPLCGLTAPSLQALLLARALNCRVAGTSKFDRKHYLYADLPKGCGCRRAVLPASLTPGPRANSYQTSQYDAPLAEGGWLEARLPEEEGGGVVRVGVTRAHLEEDSGKLVHVGADGLAGSSHSLADYNRAGAPLVEVVSEPDLRSGREAAAYAAELQRLVRFLGVGDGNMAEGSLRCDVNVSVRPRGAPGFGTKVEIKNMNSFAAMSRAVDFEVQRQVALLLADRGAEVVQETRLWEEAAQRTVSMRRKEGLADYRYYLEPDLQPLAVTPELLADVLRSLPELPAQMRERYAALGLPMKARARLPHAGMGSDTHRCAQDVVLLAEAQDVASYFDGALAAGAEAKTAANWILGDITAFVKQEKIAFADLKLQPEGLAELLAMVVDGSISGKVRAPPACSPARSYSPPLDWQGLAEAAAQGGRQRARGCGQARPGADLRLECAGGHRCAGAGWQPEAGGRVQERQGQAEGLFRWAGDAGVGGQGKPGAAGAAPHGQTDRCVATCSRARLIRTHVVVRRQSTKAQNGRQADGADAVSGGSTTRRQAEVAAHMAAGLHRGGEQRRALATQRARVCGAAKAHWWRRSL